MFPLALKHRRTTNDMKPDTIQEHQSMKVLGSLINFIAVLLCAGLGFIVIYCVCFWLYAAFAVGMDCVSAKASIGQCIADMIRAPFFLLLGPLSSVEGTSSPSPHPQVLAVALAVTVALTVITYLASRRKKWKG
ncbi:MAG: hypothetical protein ACT4O6_03090 [Reyranella sp.]